MCLYFSRLMYLYVYDIWEIIVLWQSYYKTCLPVSFINELLLLNLSYPARLMAQYVYGTWENRPACISSVSLVGAISWSEYRPTVQRLVARMRATIVGWLLCNPSSVQMMLRRPHPSPTLVVSEMQNEVKSCWHPYI